MQRGGSGTKNALTGRRYLPSGFGSFLGISRPVPPADRPVNRPDLTRAAGAPVCHDHSPPLARPPQWRYVAAQASRPAHRVAEFHSEGLPRPRQLQPATACHPFEDRQWRLRHHPAHSQPTQQHDQAVASYCSGSRDDAGIAVRSPTRKRRPTLPWPDRSAVGLVCVAAGGRIAVNNSRCLPSEAEQRRSRLPQHPPTLRLEANRAGRKPTAEAATSRKHASTLKS
jgi:hypothetical protein